MIEITEEKVLDATPEEAYIQGYKKGYDDGLKKAEPKEPIFKCGFRCANCNVQLINPRLSYGAISYCYRCGSPYKTGDAWQRIKHERK